MDLRGDSSAGAQPGASANAGARADDGGYGGQFFQAAAHASALFSRPGQALDEFDKLQPHRGFSVGSAAGGAGLLHGDSGSGGFPHQQQHHPHHHHDLNDTLVERMEELLRPQLGELSTTSSYSTSSSMHNMQQQYSQPRRSYDGSRGGMAPAGSAGSYDIDGGNSNSNSSNGGNGFGRSQWEPSSGGGFLGGRPGPGPSGAPAPHFLSQSHQQGGGSSAGLRSNGGGGSASSSASDLLSAAAAASPSTEPCRTVFVRNLPPGIQDDTLHALFSSLGDVRSLYTGAKARGYAVVSYYDLRAAMAAVERLSGHVLQGSPLEVLYSQQPRPSAADVAAGGAAESAAWDATISQGLVPMFNCDTSATREHLLWLFSQYGEVRDVRLDALSKKTVVVEFWDARHAVEALRGMNRAELSGFRLPPAIQQAAAAAATAPSSSSSSAAAAGGPQPGGSGATGAASAAAAAAALFEQEMQAAMARAASSGSLGGGASQHQQAAQQMAAAAAVAAGMHMSDSASSFGHANGSHASNGATYSGAKGPQSAVAAAAAAASLFGTSPAAAGSNGGGGGTSGLVSPDSRVDSQQELASMEAAMAAMYHHHHHHNAGAAADAAAVAAAADIAAAAVAQSQQARFDAAAAAAALSQFGMSSAGQGAMLEAAAANLWGGGNAYGGSGSGGSSSAALANLHAGLVQEQLRQQQQQHHHQQALAGLAGLQNTAAAAAANLNAAQQLLQAAALNQALNQNPLVMAQLLQRAAAAAAGGGAGGALNPATVAAAAQLLQQAGLGVPPGFAGLRHGGAPNGGGGGSGMRGGPGAAGNRLGHAQRSSGGGRPGEGGGGSSGGLAAGGGGGGGGLDAERRAQQERMFSLDLDKIRCGQDRRTTLMVKNIPNKYTQKMLLATIDETLRGAYDFFYLPIDFKNKCNVGYAFINMKQPLHIIPLVERFGNRKWERFNSEKVCSISYARIQGRAALVSHFQNSSLMHEDKRCRPLLFAEDGSDCEPCPMGPDIGPAGLVPSSPPSSLAPPGVLRASDSSGSGPVSRNGSGTALAAMAMPAAVGGSGHVAGAPPPPSSATAGG